jgi:wyosine [tRNA(Phe)-imidazoG37] synthetase (radical SAM superfamily)
VGFTKKLSINREAFFEPQLIVDEVEKHLAKLEKNNLPDYLTIVPNGEPTLDIKLGKTINKLKKFKIPIAVITNATLLSDKQVRHDLMEADWVSVKIDSGDESSWKKINKPHHLINFGLYIEGLQNFSNEFKGMLTSETMLVDGINDTYEIVAKTANLVLQTNPSIAYISIPTRPPAVATITASSPNVINQAFQIFTEKGINTELILGFEGTDTGFTGNAEEDILNISAVHPLREDTMEELLTNDKADFKVLKNLLENQKVQEIVYKSKKFYLRNHNII